jgi:hypothetical protein
MTIISAHADHNPDHLFFQRHHRGDPPIPQPPLRPLWPILALGLFLMVMGFVLVTRGLSAGAALGGMVLLALGLGCLAVFAYQLGRRID